MSNFNVVQSYWNFAQLNRIKKWASSHNLKSLTQKTKIWWNNAVSRRFGKYPFQNKQTQKQKKQTLVAKSDQKRKMGWEKQKSVSHIFLFSTYSLRFTISKIQKHNKARHHITCLVHSVEKQKPDFLQSKKYQCRG